MPSFNYSIKWPACLYSLSSTRKIIAHIHTRVINLKIQIIVSFIKKKHILKSIFEYQKDQTCCHFSQINFSFPCFVKPSATRQRSVTKVHAKHNLTKKDSTAHVHACYLTTLRSVCHSRQGHQRDHKARINVVHKRSSASVVPTVRRSSIHYIERHRKMCSFFGVKVCSCLV